jgi:hypothetical protein
MEHGRCLEKLGVGNRHYQVMAKIERDSLSVVQTSSVPLNDFRMDNCLWPTVCTDAVFKCKQIQYIIVDY